MLPFEFEGQMKRMIDVFGKGAYPGERVALIWKQVCDMELPWFARLCDRMIGDMRQAPLVSEFREAAYKERQTKFNRETEDATKRWDTGEFNGLQDYLKSIGATSLQNAVEQEVWKL